MRGTKAKIVCTRKTTPGLRAVEKYAVRAGGGANHRFGLDDAILIKDNHIAIAGGIAQALRRARAAAGHLVKIEVEVDNLDQLKEALGEGADAVLLDNMSLDRLAKAVAIVDGRAMTEASGADHAKIGAGARRDRRRSDLDRLADPQRRASSTSGSISKRKRRRDMTVLADQRRRASVAGSRILRRLRSDSPRSSVPVIELLGGSIR